MGSSFQAKITEEKKTTAHTPLSHVLYGCAFNLVYLENALRALESAIAYGKSNSKKNMIQLLSPHTTNHALTFPYFFINCQKRNTWRSACVCVWRPRKKFKKRLRMNSLKRNCSFSGVQNIGLSRVWKLSDLIEWCKYRGTPYVHTGSSNNLRIFT